MFKRPRVDCLLLAAPVVAALTYHALNAGLDARFDRIREWALDPRFDTESVQYARGILNPDPVRDSLVPAAFRDRRSEGEQYLAFPVFAFPGRYWDPARKDSAPATGLAWKPRDWHDARAFRVDGLTLSSLKEKAKTEQDLRTLAKVAEFQTPIDGPIFSLVWYPESERVTPSPEQGYRFVLEVSRSVAGSDLRAVTCRCYIYKYYRQPEMETSSVAPVGTRAELAIDTTSPVTLPDQILSRDRSLIGLRPTAIARTEKAIAESFFDALQREGRIAGVRVKLPREDERRECQTFVEQYLLRFLAEESDTTKGTTTLVSREFVRAEHWIEWPRRLNGSNWMGLIQYFTLVAGCGVVLGASIVAYLRRLGGAEASPWLAGLVASYCHWAIPSLGFLGTIIGIGSALVGASDIVGGDRSAKQLAIQRMTNDLGIAFDTTLVALALGLVCTLVYSALIPREPTAAQSS